MPHTKQTNKQNSNKQYNKSKPSNSILRTNAFTLVELIVVIVILAILATIAFLSFSSYSSSARDSNRLSDVSAISHGLEVYQATAGSYPFPDGTISTGSIKGVDVAYKGMIGEKVAKLIGVSKAPVDPLETTINYPYGITYDKKKYQVALVKEDSSTTAYYGSSNISDRLVTNISDALIDKAYADGNNKAKVQGNYNGVIKFSTGSKTYIANVPSLIFNLEAGASDLIENKDNVFFVTNDGINIPYKIGGNSSLNNKTTDEVVKELSKNTAATFTGVDISSVVAAKGATEKATAITGIFGDGTSDESKALLASFGVSGSDASTTISNMASVISGGGGGSGVSGSVVSSGGGDIYNPEKTYISGQIFSYNLPSGKTVSVTVSGDGYGTISGSKSTHNPECDTDDIAVWQNGGNILQVWSACNVGASKASEYALCDGSDETKCTLDRLGYYFQWGRNKGFFPGINYTTSSEKITINPNLNDTWEFIISDNDMWYNNFDETYFSLWGGSVNDTNTSDGNETTSIGRKGPCDNGYHVPSYSEISKLENINPSYMTTLMLPKGRIGKRNDFQTRIWSSTSRSENFGESRYLGDDGSSDRGGMGLHVRCIKD